MNGQGVDLYACNLRLLRFHRSRGPVPTCCDLYRSNVREGTRVTARASFTKRRADFWVLMKLAQQTIGAPGLDHSFRLVSMMPPCSHPLELLPSGVCLHFATRSANNGFAHKRVFRLRRDADVFSHTSMMHISHDIHQAYH